ncbi:metallophosphoesterase [Salipiger abyssi]|uniref:metallophosphoesterase n=1 Tax=Salipiger abyssi TaxID=1250539 RepID=UPI001A8EBC75|nr:metallophosphoesterase [Salipiger abyssi]MBN9886672.1 serine/threonine protein phosphatase [Salipiger abyssi]
MPPIFAVGDIHGQLSQLQQALDYIVEDPEAGAPVVFLGDFVDRGPESSAVIETLMRGQSLGLSWICLMGNHDRFFLRYLENPFYQDPQTRNPHFYTDPPIGGDKTLASYGVDADPRRDPKEIHADAVAAVPQAHRDWLAALPRVYETEQQIFVHAGLRPGVPIAEQSEDDLLWIRRAFLNDTRDYGRLVVHGHTAIDVPHLYANRLNMDGGAGYGNPLYPALLLGGEVFLLGSHGRVRL